MNAKTDVNVINPTRRRVSKGAAAAAAFNLFQSGPWFSRRLAKVDGHLALACPPTQQTAEEFGVLL